jgi:hypothetical protein
VGSLGLVRWMESGLLDRMQLDGTTLENSEAVASSDGMQQPEMKSPSAAPGITEADDTLAILARILPYRIDDLHALGIPERPTAFLLHLTTKKWFTVDLDSEGRILGIRWSVDEDGLGGCGLADDFARMPLPLLLMRRTAKEVLLSDRAAFLVGNNGITFKNAEGDVEFIAAEELIGFSHRPSDQPLPPQ